MRVFLSFWVFGCLATMQFVVVVTAANDLVGNQAPPGLILFAYTLPSVLIRAFVPYIRFPTIRKEVNYALRLSISALSSFTGLQLLSFSKSLPLRVLGISLTSLSSNLGDMSFYQLATRFPISMTQSLGGYAAGSGAAGLIGSAVYTILTSWAGVETPYVLSGMGLVPVILLVVYGLLLPEVEIGPTGEEEEELNSIETNLEAGHGSAGNQIPHLRIQDLAVRDKLKLVQPMVLGYMLPLATLMLLENTTIQGILPNSIFYLPLGIGRDGTKPAAPSLLSPLFKSPRDFYPTYITIYQLAVFAGRTSINFVRLPSSAGAVIYWVLCLVELFCFMIQYGEGISMTYSALDDRDVWFGPAGVMFIIALMGLCGGVGMSNTYWRASKEKLPRREAALREFLISTIALPDTLAIMLASVVSLWMQPRGCRLQVEGGRGLCVKAG
ncbi:batten's disease protein Cln3 [Peziza echinospora]|nr:batten's disease protein Cln3 [Peziza echinospora]